jgi:hypothetical protein
MWRSTISRSGPPGPGPQATIDRRRADLPCRRAEEGWDSWDPDSPSPIDTSPSTIDTSLSPIDDPEPVPALTPEKAASRRRHLTASTAQPSHQGHVTWDASVASGTARAHQHAAGARKDGAAQKEPPGGAGPPGPADHALGRPRAGSPASSTWPASRGRSRWRSSSRPATATTAPGSPSCWTPSASPAPAAADPALGRTGSWLTRPTASARTGPTALPRHPLHYTRESRSGRQREEEGQLMGQAAHLRPRAVHAAPRSEQVIQSLLPP